MKTRTPRTRVCVFSILVMTLIAWTAVASEPSSDAPDAEQAEATPKNRLSWSTATESENFGYDIYRSESEDGPFERLNPDPIPGAGTTDKRTTYEFIDDSIEPDTTYWYYLESISMSGVKERFTEVFRKDPSPKAEPSGQNANQEEKDGASNQD